MRESQPTGAVRPFDVRRVREDFPFLNGSAGDGATIYLDTAASAQKPRVVIEAVSGFYEAGYANIHRGIHRLSQQATLRYESVRRRIAAWINAESPDEIVFVRSTTEAINLVAQSFLRPQLRPGDQIVLTQMEHHSNIVPWQLVAEATGAVVRAAPIDERGELDFDQFQRLLESGTTRMAAVSHTSNALGTINPVPLIAAACRERGVPLLIDAAQAVPHQRVDVRALGADFLVFSSHKLYGPSGVGVLYGRAHRLEAMPPYQGGGEMISRVSFEGTSYNVVPHRFEAGTPNIEGVIGFGAALDYLESVGIEAIEEHEHNLLEYATRALSRIDRLRLIGTATRKAPVISFVLEGVHAHDVGTILDSRRIAVRAGHHCAQPAIERFGLAATTRASFGLYNTLEEIDQLVDGIEAVKELFSR
jgi:cysteine desulfurase/selenocysteine lyase